MELLSLDQIKDLVRGMDLLPEIEAGFKAYSEGRAIVPPVGEMLLDKGEVHIKYGFIKGDPYYVIKVASGFYRNPAIGLPSGNGMMLLFSQHTGSTECILLDEGYLTNVRTAVAGAIAARYLAPEGVEQIGILGAGVQARMQLSWLKGILPSRKALVWSIDKEELGPYRVDMEAAGFNVETTGDIGRIAEHCQIIVSTTPSKTPLLHAGQLKKGTHITAVGSDTTEKQELDSAILRDADVVVADSIAQCMERGEIFRAMRSGMLEKEKVRELGRVISGSEAGRTSADQITVADLTGVAVQDINIAAAVFEAHRARKV
jgi:ornithine cyclodeaminase